MKKVKNAWKAAGKPYPLKKWARHMIAAHASFETYFDDFEPACKWLERKGARLERVHASLKGA